MGGGDAQPAALHDDSRESSFQIEMSEVEEASMKRARLAIVSAAIFALTAGVTTVSHGQGATGNSPKDFVVGGGHHSVPDTQFTLSVHSGRIGENPKGQMTFKIEDQPRILVEVTCLVVEGNQAIATGVITRPLSFAGQPVVTPRWTTASPTGRRFQTSCASRSPGSSPRRPRS
jgi:hypothetical protein